MRALRAAALATLVAAAVVGSACGSPRTATANPNSLTDVAAATARYQYLANAIVDGYLPSGGCIADAGGAMGQHYVNRALLGQVDARHPAELFYVPIEGTLRLAGVEYYADATSVTTPPELFGHPFDGPMPGHVGGQPEHYDLHVWLFLHNPAGTFAPYDPELSCS